jgi:CRISPR/Cas system-associated endonuclease Cas1
MGLLAPSEVPNAAITGSASMILLEMQSVVVFTKKLGVCQAVQSQINFLKSLDRDDLGEGIAVLSQYIMKANNACSKSDLLTIEARAGNLYFRTYVKLFDPKY